MRASSWAAGLSLMFIAASASAKNDESTELSARRDGIGAVFTGLGGLATADSRLHEGAGADSPDPLRDVRLGIEGERAVGGFASDLLVRISDVRFGFGSVLAFGDSFRLDAPPLANGFTVQPGSTVIATIHAYVGKQFRLGPVLPYADLQIGASIYGTTVRLYHPSLGFLGETQHAAYRFALGPRAGVSIPLGSIFFIDAGVRGELLGFLRVTGYAGIGAFFGP